MPHPCEMTTQQELLQLVEISKQVDGIRLAQIQEMDTDLFGVWSKFLGSHGITVNAEELHKMVEPYEPIIDYLKVIYNRPRPHQTAGLYGIPLYPRLDNVPIESAYPSGHTLFSLYIFHFFSLTHPELQEEMMKLVLDVKLSREQGGVHYPSDGLFSFQVFNHIRPFMSQQNTIVPANKVLIQQAPEV